VRRSGFGWQLALAFARVAVAAAAIAGLMLSSVWQRQFESYVRERLFNYAEGYALTYRDVYIVAGGWPSRIQIPQPRLFEEGTRVELFDGSGNKLVDSQPGGLTSTFEPPSGSVGATAPVVVLDQQGRTHNVGTIRVWSNSPGGLLSETDLAFRQTSMRAVLLAALIAVGLATAAGALYARRISRPISQVTETAAAIRAGRREARTGMSGDDPVGVLGRTLDEMADSIEADREFERRLTADVAHELRTPLQAIQATVEAMQDGVLPADEERLETVRSETMRLARLADSILELARLERGAVPMRREPVDPSLPLLAALDTHRALLEGAGLSLVEEVDRGLAVCGDTDRLTQAFGNLISNAVRYTTEGGTVTVRLSAEGGDAVVSVADTGIGISEEDLSRVFVRFWRADAARSRATGGLGVGLAVVKEIVDRHSGRITVTSAPGNGTVFTVRLPLEPVAVEPARARMPAFKRA
jgi:signal transduction histidine kinase